MMKKLLSTALLAAPLTLAHAGAWNFQYQGFYDQQVQAFDESMVLSGWFAGDDVDANGILDTTELTEFHAGGTDYMRCGGQLVCIIDAFNFAPGGQLDFTVARFFYGDTFISGHTIVAGSSINEYVNEDGNTNYMAEWLWTDATTFSISPVPEPATWLMLASGAVLVAVRRLRGSASR